MGAEEVLAGIKEADMVLVGLGEEFDDISRLRSCREYVKGSELLEESGHHWLLPAWDEYCAARVGEDVLSPALKKLADILSDKNYFVVSTAADRRIAAISWKEKRIVMPCGTTLRKQCAKGDCGIDDVSAAEREQMESAFAELFAGDLSPGGIAEFARCGCCGGVMVLNHISAEHYDERGYMAQWELYRKWLQGTLNRRLLVLELGVGLRFPSVIRWPFEKMVYFNRKATLVRVHEKLYQLTEELAGKGRGIPENAIAWLERL